MLVYACISRQTSLFRLTLTPRLSIRYPAKRLKYINYQYDLAIIADIVINATVLLHHLENVANDSGHYDNTTKTEFIGFNQQSSMQTVSGKAIKSVESFTFIGTEVNSSVKDVKIRMFKDWTASNKMDMIWKSNLPHLKVLLSSCRGDVSGWCHCLDIN